MFCSSSAQHSFLISEEQGVCVTMYSGVIKEAFASCCRWVEVWVSVFLNMVKLQSKYSRTTQLFLDFSHI